ncbi:hypothetical protein ABFS83_08G060400 [Erythranthe nasuta]
MLSTFPATLSGDSFVGNFLPSFEPGFPNWDFHEPSFLFHDQEPVIFSPHPSHEPVTSNSGSDASNPALSPDSCEPNQNQNSGSDDRNPNHNNCKKVVDERKRRRMLSNRESARRSRMRKQKHTENLRNQANRLKVGNRELMNRLRLVVHQSQMVRSENEYLMSEAAVLRQRLWDIRQLLLVRHLHQQLLNPSA